MITENEAVIENNFSESRLHDGDISGTYGQNESR